MNPARIRPLWIALIIGGCAATLLLHRAALSQLRLDNSRLRDENLQVPLPGAATPREPGSEIDSDESEQLLRASRALPRLRAEVAQLRRERAEIQKLAGENEALRRQQAAKAPSPRSTADPFGQASQAPSDAGFSTPTAAIQTFLWAASQGDRKRLLECVAPELKAPFEQEWDNFAQAGTPHPLLALKQMSGFSVLEMQTITPQQVVLSVQTDSSSGTAVARFAHKQVGDEWKMIEDRTGR